MIDRLVGAIAAQRRRHASQHPESRRSLLCPVISIGNLSMGGSGKSPLVAHVVRLLLDAGQRPAVLSRGYARPNPVDGAVVVSDGDRLHAGYDTAGDEPLMLARQLPGCIVVVSPDRYLAGSLAERRLGCTVHVLDDGFQHVQLARDLDLVIVRRWDLGDRVLPLGRLREAAGAMAEADAVIVDAEEQIVDEVARLGAQRTFTMTRRPGSPDEWPVFAFAGIGRPGDFFDALRRHGWSLVGSKAFADHHRYTTADVARLVVLARRSGARLLVTTEKDMARLEEHKWANADVPLKAVPLAVGVEPHDAFVALLQQAIAKGA